MRIWAPTFTGGIGLCHSVLLDARGGARGGQYSGLRTMLGKRYPRLRGSDRRSWPWGLRVRVSSCRPGVVEGIGWLLGPLFSALGLCQVAGFRLGRNTNVVRADGGGKLGPIVFDGVTGEPSGTGKIRGN